MISYKTINGLPTICGVYQFLNEKGDILYIGKASNIKKRVQQHIRGKNASAKNERMLSQVKEIKWIETDNDVEALILENSLIKEHHPKYNILLKDDKNFLYIKISVTDPFPRLSMVRRMTDTHSRYFGPYTNASNIRETFALLEKIFPYNCLTFFVKGVTTSPCFNYHIHRCPGLCIGAISQREYREIIHYIIRFLEGDIKDTIRTLRVKMEQESEDKQYEKASKTRDNLFALQAIADKQKVVDPNAHVNQDIVAYAAIRNLIFVNIFHLRRGTLIGQDNLTFTLPPSHRQRNESMTSTILQEYYEAATAIPEQIIVPYEPEDKLLLEKWLRNKKGGKTTILVPEKGKKHELLALSERNAEHYAEREIVKKEIASGIDANVGVRELQKVLGLKSSPKRIEGYDISHMGGKFTVASMVVFQEGKPLKSHYRQFKLDTIKSRADDYQALRETLQRRLKYISNPLFKKMIKNKKESFLQVPDLLVLDGGKGQLSIGMQILSEVGLQKKIPVISIAKEEESIFTPGKLTPLSLPKDSQAQYLLERIRDEAHRFANTFHKKVHTKSVTASLLQEIKGFGSVKRKKLMARYKSLRYVKEAPLEEIEKIVGKKLAKEIKERL